MATLPPSPSRELSYTGISSFRPSSPTVGAAGWAGGTGSSSRPAPPSTWGWSVGEGGSGAEGVERPQERAQGAGRGGPTTAVPRAAAADTAVSGPGVPKDPQAARTSAAAARARAGLLLPPKVRQRRVQLATYARGRAPWPTTPASPPATDRPRRVGATETRPPRPVAKYHGPPWYFRDFFLRAESY